MVIINLGPNANVFRHKFPHSISTIWILKGFKLILVSLIGKKLSKGNIAQRKGINLRIKKTIGQHKKPKYRGS